MEKTVAQLREMGDRLESEGRLTEAHYARRAASRLEAKQGREFLERAQRVAETPHEATYTTAPSDYDWFGTEEMVPVAGEADGKTVRKVYSPVGEVQAQRGRYLSGNHGTYSEGEFAKLVSYGLAKDLICKVA